MRPMRATDYRPVLPVAGTSGLLSFLFSCGKDFKRRSRIARFNISRLSGDALLMSAPTDPDLVHIIRQHDQTSIAIALVLATDVHDRPLVRILFCLA